MPKTKYLFKPSLEPSEVPPDVRRLTRRNRATYFGATEYYAKFADMAPHRVSAWMEQIGSRSYALKKPFSEYFSHMLRHKLAQYRDWGSPRSPKSAADFVAIALSSAACMFKSFDFPRAKLLRSGQLWPRERCVSEAWHELGDLKEYIGPSRQIREWTGKNLCHPTTAFDFPRVAIYEDFSCDMSKLPRLTLTFEGPPIALLYRAHHDIEDLEERTRVRKQALRLMTELFNHALKTLQLKHPDANRPRQRELGAEAAWLHDGEGMSWSQVAKKLCGSKHTHDSNCSTRMRLAATRWYKGQSPRDVPIVVEN